MEKYIHHYYRDDIEIPYEEWNELFNTDLEKENENSVWIIRKEVVYDFSIGRDCELNGHEYKNRVDYVYDTAKELLDKIIDGSVYELITAIKMLPEEEAEKLITYIERAEKGNDCFILKDERDYDVW